MFKIKNVAKEEELCQSGDVISVGVVVVDLPHVDQVLSQSDRLRVAGNGDRAIRVAAGLAVLAVGNPDHGSAELSEIETGVSHF